MANENIEFKLSFSVPEGYHSFSKKSRQKLLKEVKKHYTIIESKSVGGRLKIHGSTPFYGWWYSNQEKVGAEHHVIRLADEILKPIKTITESEINLLVIQNFLLYVGLEEKYAQAAIDYIEQDHVDGDDK